MQNLASLPPAHVVAYSMGARLALEALFYYNAPFLSLTCLSSTLEVHNKEHRKEMESRWIDQLNSHSTENFIKQWYRQNIFGDFNIPKRRYTQNKEALIQILEEYSILKAPSFLTDIWYSKTPIHFIFKENDPKADPLKGFQNLHFVPGISHCIHLENKKELLFIIKNILNMHK